MKQSESPLPLQPQLEQLYADSNVAIVGSLARAAIMGETLSPVKEDGQLRDIDALRLHYDPDRLAPGAAFPKTIGPHHVDWVYNEWFHFGENTSWITCPYDGRIQEEVSNDIFHTQTNRLSGLPVRTLDPRAHLNLQYIMGPLRPKDVPGVSQLAAYVDRQDDLLPAELFDPIVRFSAAVAARRQRLGLRVAEGIGGAILTLIPEVIKQRTRPISRRITHKVIRHLRG